MGTSALASVDVFKMLSLLFISAGNKATFAARDILKIEMNKVLTSLKDCFAFILKQMCVRFYPSNMIGKAYFMLEIFKIFGWSCFPSKLCGLSNQFIWAQSFGFT